MKKIKSEELSNIDEDNILPKCEDILNENNEKSDILIKQDITETDKKEIKSESSQEIKIKKSLGKKYKHTKSDITAKRIRVKKNFKKI